MMVVEWAETIPMSNEGFIKSGGRGAESDRYRATAEAR